MQNAVLGMRTALSFSREVWPLSTILSAASQHANFTSKVQSLRKKYTQRIFHHVFCLLFFFHTEAVSCQAWVQFFPFGNLTSRLLCAKADSHISHPISDLLCVLCLRASKQKRNKAQTWPPQCARTYHSGVRVFKVVVRWQHDEV